MLARYGRTAMRSAVQHGGFPSRSLLPRPPIGAARTLCTSTPSTTSSAASFVRSYRLAVAVALPVAALLLPNASSLLSSASGFDDLHCASDRSYSSSSSSTTLSGEDMVAVAAPMEKEKDSHTLVMSLYKLSFGTAAGVCVGLFVVKGLKVVAVSLGGVYVLLQYLASHSFITINWTSLTSSYDSLFDPPSTSPGLVRSRYGNNRLMRLINGSINFLAADLPSRATFVAGVVIGIRLRGV